MPFSFIDFFITGMWFNDIPSIHVSLPLEIISIIMFITVFRMQDTSKIVKNIKRNHAKMYSDKNVPKNISEIFAIVGNPVSAASHACRLIKFVLSFVWKTFVVTALYR
jgi:hypothetical protein